MSTAGACAAHALNMANAACRQPRRGCCGGPGAQLTCAPALHRPRRWPWQRRRRVREVGRGYPDDAQEGFVAGSEKFGFIETHAHWPTRTASNRLSGCMRAGSPNLATGISRLSSSTPPPWATRAHPARRSRPHRHPLPLPRPLSSPKQVRGHGMPRLPGCACADVTALRAPSRRSPAGRVGPPSRVRGAAC